MAPSDWEMQAATPSLPFPPLPTGHCTALSAPTLDCHSGLSCDSQLVNTKVVPDSSARWHTWIGLSGRVTLGFSDVIAGSFQLLTLPRKMSATVDPSNLSGSLTSLRLYATATPPSTVGNWRIVVLPKPVMSVLCSGASEAPKSTVFCWSCSIPPPEPMAW